MNNLNVKGIVKKDFKAGDVITVTFGNDGRPITSDDIDFFTDRHLFIYEKIIGEIINEGIINE